MSAVTGRFAPSPSGRLHLGNLACSLLAWLSARSQGGRIVLRIEDLDAERCPRKYADALEQDLRWLTEHGYHTVLPRELAGGEPLPEKPLLITFDDGYRSNYELLFPLLQAYQMKAVVSIMVYMQDVSADNFLSWDMCREMADSGLVEIGSHAYSLHNLGDLGGNFDPGGINGIQRDPEESDSAFEARVLGDIQKSHDRIAQEVGQPVTFFAYPFGITEPDAEAFVHELFPVTAVTRHGTADLGKGLHELPRMTVTMDRELEDILKD